MNLCILFFLLKDLLLQINDLKAAVRDRDQRIMGNKFVYLIFN